MNSSYFCWNWKKFTFWTKCQTSWDLCCSKRFKSIYWFRFLNKVPFIENTILTRNNQRVRVWSNGRANNGCYNTFHKNKALLLILINFLKKRGLKQSNPSIIINNNKIITFEWPIISIIQLSSIHIISIFNNTTKRNSMNRTQINLLKPCFYSILIIIETYGTIGWTNNKEFSLDF